MFGNNNRTINGCCKGCEKRYPGCHDHCDKYQAAKKDWESFKELRKVTPYLKYKYDAIQKAGRSRKYE